METFTYLTEKLRLDLFIQACHFVEVSLPILKKVFEKDFPSRDWSYSRHLLHIKNLKESPGRDYYTDVAWIAEWRMGDNAIAVFMQ